MTRSAEAATPELTPFARMKAILGGSAGNLVEWYDWFAYAAFTLYFAPQFFPKGDQTVQLLQAAAVFFLGFVARPIGAWMMGLYADHAGRRAALSISVALMCAGALIIAVTPSYATIGLWAPAILLLARVLQGLSVGGEYGASATYMSEMAGKTHRGFWSSFHYVTLIAGQLLALGVLIVLQRTLDKAALSEWGWRVPFVIGAALAVVVFWIRTGLDESVSYRNAKVAGAEKARTSMLILRHPRETLLIMGLTAGGSLTFYVYTTYMQKFLVNTSGFSKAVASEISAISLIAFLLLQPVAGWLSDRVGRRPMLILAFAGGVLTIWPIMNGIAHTTSPTTALMLILTGITCQSAYTSISAVVKAELFPAHIRALGVALPYALANVVFGGTAEMAALAFKSSGLESAFYLYVAGVMALGLLCAILLKDTGRHSKIIED